MSFFIRKTWNSSENQRCFSDVFLLLVSKDDKSLVFMFELWETLFGAVTPFGLFGFDAAADFVPLC